MEDYINIITLIESRNNTGYTHIKCTYNLDYYNGTHDWRYSPNLFKIKTTNQLIKEWR
jgi:hypothetical protein